MLISIIKRLLVAGKIGKLGILKRLACYVKNVQTEQVERRNLSASGFYILRKNESSRNSV